MSCLSVARILEIVQLLASADIYHFRSSGRFLSPALASVGRARELRRAHVKLHSVER